MTKRTIVFKTLKQLVLVFGLMALMLQIKANLPSVLAAVLPLPDSSNYGNIPASTSGGSAEKQFYDLVFGIIQNVRYIIGAVAIGLCVYGGLRMVVSFGNEDVYNKQKQNFLWAVIGLALVGMSGEAARIFQVACDSTKLSIPGQSCTPGGFLADPNAIIRQTTLFSQRTQFLIVFIKYFIGSVAVLEIVFSGMKMVTMGELEDKMTIVKKNLAYGFLGLLLIIFSDSLINKVFYKLDTTHYPSTGGAQPGVDPGEGVKQLVAITNIVVSIVSPIAVIALVAAGVMYMTAGGSEDKQGKAKRMAFMVIVGILLMYSAFAIVSTFISGSFQDGGGSVTQTTGTSINAQ